MTKFPFSNSSFPFNATLNETLLRILLESHIGKIKSKDSVTIGLVMLYVPTFLAGIIGNALLAVVILTRRRHRNMTNLFLCNLAVADLSGKI